MGVSVSAYLDIQKSINDEPYLRMVNCQIDDGFIETRVANMGLLTDTVNMKYRKKASLFPVCIPSCAIDMKYASGIEIVLCGSIVTTECFQMKDLLIIYAFQLNSKLEVDSEAARVKRASNLDYYDDIENNEKKSTGTKIWSSTIAAIRTGNKSVREGGSNNITFIARDITHFFNVERLRHLMIDMTLLDASATHEDFTVGISGQVSSTKSTETSPYRIPFPFRLPPNSQRRMVEIAVSEYSANTLLYFAHKTNSLLFHVDSHSPGVGSLLKTTCTVDEVCLSDQVEEVGTAYPDRSLELIIRTTSPPIIALEKDIIRLSLKGRCLFFLEGTRQRVGVIPFTAEVHMRLQTEGTYLKGKVSITKLTFNNGVDFFQLTISDLDGLRKTTKTAIENMANAVFGAGIPLSTSSANSPLRLSALQVSILPGVALLQANVDLYSSFYNHSS
ncbi:LBP / BPI / CETP family protein [Necator americanus]|uniref:LBP / BPI / CETP family protein n=1 Tax=Necator americanus TaxID=51031 RepID=W2TKH3_NECAM|nr:LBP / BPI / CETP family protein [Necator americanus]ETN82258.1 LBP / BPI / CETP family protein [Necator americanus]